MSIAEQIEELKNDFDNVKQAGYAEGYEVGKSEGGDTDAAYQQGVADGKQAEYDAFWNGFQGNKGRTNYSYAFMRWTDEMYNPKYPFTKDNIMPLREVNSMFYSCYITDLSNLYLQLMSTATSGFNATFYQSQALTKVGTLRSGATTPQYASTFYGCTALESVELMQISSNTPLSNTFTGCFALKEVTFLGNIGRTLNLGNCADLTQNTINHIFDQLVAPTTTNQKLTFNAAVFAKLTDTQKAKATELGWTLASQS